MPVYSFECSARQANDEIVPADLVATLQPNSSRLFFVKLTVKFHHPHSQNGPLTTTRHVLKILVPRNEVSGLNRSAWEAIIDFLNQVGSPTQALSETVFRLTCCAAQMVADRDNAGRMVLPMEGLLNCTAVAEGDEMAGVVTVQVEVEGVVCAVCLKEMEVRSTASRLPCLHLFHERCIRQWFTYNRSCPLCRFQLG